MRHKPFYVLGFQLHPKQNETPACSAGTDAGLRDRTPSLGLGWALFCVAFWWLRGFCLSCDLDPNLNPFWAYFLSLNIHTKYVYLAKYVSKSVSFNWIIFVKYKLNSDFSTNTTLSPLPSRGADFWAKVHFPSLPSVVSHHWLAFWQSNKWTLCVYSNPSSSG